MNLLQPRRAPFTSSMPIGDDERIQLLVLSGLYRIDVDTCHGQADLLRYFEISFHQMKHWRRR